MGHNHLGANLDFKELGLGGFFLPERRTVLRGVLASPMMAEWSCGWQGQMSHSAPVEKYLRIR